MADDSAGGNLATVVTLLCRDRRGPAVRFQALAYPVTDHWQAGRASYDQYVEGYTLSGLPATLIITAEFDPLRDEGRAYAERLRAAGAAVEHVHLDDQMHGFLLQETTVDRAREAVDHFADALRRGLA